METAQVALWVIALLVALALAFDFMNGFHDAANSIATVVSTGVLKPAHAVLRHIHGLSPFPGGWSEVAVEGEAVRVKILRCEPASGAGVPGTLLDDQLTIACSDGAIRIVELQRAGKAPMKASEFLRGTPLQAGARFA